MLKSPKSIPDRKIDTWYYDVKDLTVPVDENNDTIDDDEIDGEADGEHPVTPAGSKVVTNKVRIDLYICKETLSSDTPPYPLKEVSFSLKCKEPKFTLCGTDLEVLRAAAWARLDVRYEVKWQAHYLVTVERSQSWGSGTSNGLSMSYDHVWKGTTWDGKLLLKKYSSHYRHTIIEPWPGAFTDKGGRAIACIEDNEQNKSALEEFSRRMDVLRELMTENLKPEYIEQTLANLAGYSLLPKAEPKKVTNGKS